MAITKGIHALSRCVDRVCAALCVLMIGAMVLMTGAQIICRVLFTALSWSEEVARYLLVWSTFMGAGCVYKSSGHISVTLLENAVPQSFKKPLALIVHLLCAVLFGIAVYYGFKYMGMQGRQLSAALRIPMKYVYMAIPLGCSVMLLHAVDAVVALFEKKGEEA